MCIYFDIVSGTCFKEKEGKHDIRRKDTMKLIDMLEIFNFSTRHRSSYGRLAKYADYLKREQEKLAFEKAMIEKHKKVN